jgi:enoyl-CoA hydratase/carnithine racemase
MFEYKTVRWSLHAAGASEARTIGVLTLSRPEVLNAIDVRMRIELDLLFDQIRRDDSIRVVIVTGEGKGFSAGGDLRTEAAPLGALDEENDFGAFAAYKELANYFFNDLRHLVIQRAIRKLEALQAITIAAINGPAVGIGLELATACDIRYASDKARLGEVAVPAGFVPESGGARNLPKLVGMGRAMEMILTGEIVDAAEAHRIGLVERVFPHDELYEVLFPLRNGVAGSVMNERASPERILATIERDKVTLLYSVATLYRRILAAPGIEERFDLSSLRGANSTGEPLEASVRDEWSRRMGCPIWEHYGVSEAQMLLGDGPRTPRRAGSVGKSWGARAAILGPDLLALPGGAVGTRVRC